MFAVNVSANYRHIQGLTFCSERGISRSHYVLMSQLLHQEAEGRVVAA